VRKPSRAGDSTGGGLTAEFTCRRDARDASAGEMRCTARTTAGWTQLTASTLPKDATQAPGYLERGAAGGDTALENSLQVAQLSSNLIFRA